MLEFAKKKDGSWILDAGYWILDTGYWMLDVGYWMLADKIASYKIHGGMR